jgi:adenylate kinase
MVRADDQEATIRERLRAYQRLTGPILAWYGPAAVHTIDGAMPPEAVREAVASVVEAARMARGPAISPVLP